MAADGQAPRALAGLIPRRPARQTPAVGESTRQRRARLRQANVDGIVDTVLQTILAVMGPQAAYGEEPGGKRQVRPHGRRSPVAAAATYRTFCLDVALNIGQARP